MADLFGSTTTHSFNLFSLSHVIMIAIYIIGFALIMLFVPKLSNRHGNITRWVLLGILLLSETSYQTWGLLNGTWNSKEYLPFQLCSFAGVLTIIALATRNNHLIKVCFFISIFPAFLAVVTPELFHGFPHFRFWQFFIHHIILSWASIFLVVSTKVHITWKNTWMIYLYLLIYAAIVGFILNPMFDANFLFLARASSADTPLNMLGDGIWYYVNLCTLGFIVFVAMFGMYKLFINNDRKPIV